MKAARTVSLLVTTAVCYIVGLPASSVPTPTAADLPPTMPQELTPPKRGEMPLEFFNYLKDCLLVNVKDGQQQYAAWLPLRTFLRMYAAGGGNSERLESKVDELKPYLMFVVENRLTDQYKNSSSESAESLRRRAVLRLPDGTEVKPVDRNPEGMPAHAPSFGTLGRRGQLLIFPTPENKNLGDLDAETARKGKLQLVLQASDDFKESSFVWHLPLELAGTTKECSKCHNDLSGKWSYCPWCGSKQR